MKWGVFFCKKVDLSSMQDAFSTVSVFFISNFTYLGLRTHPMHPLPTDLVCLVIIISPPMDAALYETALQQER